MKHILDSMETTAILWIGTYLYVSYYLLIPPVYMRSLQTDRYLAISLTLIAASFVLFCRWPKTLDNLSNKKKLQLLWVLPAVVLLIYLPNTYLAISLTLIAASFVWFCRWPKTLDNLSNKKKRQLLWVLPVMLLIIHLPILIPRPIVKLGFHVGKFLILALIIRNFVLLQRKARQGLSKTKLIQELGLVAAWIPLVAFCLCAGYFFSLPIVLLGPRFVLGDIGHFVFLTGFCLPLGLKTWLSFQVGRATLTPKQAAFGLKALLLLTLATPFGYLMVFNEYPIWMLWDAWFDFWMLWTGYILIHLGFMAMLKMKNHYRERQSMQRVLEETYESSHLKS